jgi:mono/diheme cytochrome c family protein
MKKVLKWIGIVLAVVVGVLILAVVGLSIAGGAQLNKTQDVQAEAITIPTDEASLARGDHLVNIICTGCHTDNLTGQPLLDDPSIGTIYSANISGLAETHSDADIVRAIRHGVDTDGRHLVIMPAEAFINFSAEDLGSIIAYLKTIPRSGSENPQPHLTLMGRILLATGQFGDVFPADYIDHSKPFPPMPEIGANPQYGEYLAQFCTSCHGENFAGGYPPEPDAPFARNLTPAGELGSWTEEDFLNFWKTGMTPLGQQINTEFMPVDEFGKLDPDELRGLWLYLHSLPAIESPSQ